MTDLPDDQLILHGKLRVLRIERDKQCQALRGAIQPMHSNLMKILHQLDAPTELPHFFTDFQELFDQAKQHRQAIADIDAQREEVKVQLTAHMR